MNELDYYNVLTKHYTKKALEVQSSIVWDAKFTRTDSIPFSCLSPHQEDNMLLAMRSMGYKIPDAGYDKKPFDGFAVYGAMPVLAVIFYKTGKTLCYEIPLGNFIYEREHSKRKSLTQQRAEAISTVSYLLTARSIVYTDIAVQNY